MFKSEEVNRSLHAGHLGVSVMHVFNIARLRVLSVEKRGRGIKDYIILCEFGLWETSSWVAPPSAAANADGNIAPAPANPALEHITACLLATLLSARPSRSMHRLLLLSGAPYPQMTSTRLLKSFWSTNSTQDRGFMYEVCDNADYEYMDAYITAFNLNVRVMRPLSDIIVIDHL